MGAREIFFQGGRECSASPNQRSTVNRSVLSGLEKIALEPTVSLSLSFTVNSRLLRYGVWNKRVLSVTARHAGKRPLETGQDNRRGFRKGRGGGDPSPFPCASGGFT